MAAAVASSPGGNAGSHGQEDPTSAATAGRPLPKTCTPMYDIKEGKTNSSFATVVGLVKDCRLPVTTKTGDLKMTLKLFDKSLEDECTTLDLHIFGKRQEDMPVVGAADVVLLQNAKVQEFRGDRSLLTNFSTSIYVYASDKIPPEPQSPAPALRTATWNSANKNKTAPTPEESRYVSWLFHHLDKTLIPEAVEFEARVAKSLNIQDKFGTLKDLTDGRFYNLIARVVHKPYQTGDSVALWVTDYTENPRFQDFTEPDGTPSKGVQVGDSMGYLDKSTAKVGSKLASEWTGPPGKMSMQVTCYEPHAEYIRNYVTVNKWVELANVQAKMGRNGACLEGFMRADLDYGNPVRVSCIDVHPEDRDSVDPRYKDALRRFRDYTIRSRASLAHKKRKAGGEPPPQDKKQNKSKEQRKLKRARKSAASNGQQASGGSGGEDDKGDAVAMASNLNGSIVSDHQGRPTTALAEALAPVCCEATKSDGTTARVPLPFVNAKFRAQVRVVDFLPPRLEGFAAGRQPNELDILSDNEGDMDDDSSDDDEPARAGATGGLGGGVYEPPVWEWRFALLLEDATPATTTTTTTTTTNPPARLWVVVDNAEAQMLTGLSACDLRCHVDVLDALRERMFVLWGDLEEKKRQQLRAAREADIAAAARRRKEEQQKREQQKKQKQKLQQQLNRRPGQAYPLPPDSSEDEWHGSSSKNTGAGRPKGETAQQPVEQPGSLATVSNRPFVCCVRQYGVRVPAPGADDDSGSGSGSGAGSTWQRTFGLFGTKICAAPGGD